MTAVKCYEAFKNGVALAVKNPGVVAAQHVSPRVSKSCKGNEHGWFARTKEVHPSFRIHHQAT